MHTLIVEDFRLAAGLTRVLSCQKALICKYQAQLLMVQEKY
jgi:hypothetical protein